MMDELDCQDVVEMVTDYLEGRLAARERVSLEAHLKECDGCETYLAQIKRVLLILGTVDLESIPQDTRHRFVNTFRSWRENKAS